MHANAKRVVAGAADAGVTIEVVEYPEGTRTAQDAADAVGGPVSSIVKSLVFLLDDHPVMALVAGHNRLDEAKLAAALDGSTVGRADADAVRAATGYPIGGVPPFALATDLATVVDRALLDHEQVWAAAGTPRHVFAVAPEDLVRLCGGSVADLAQ
ncbi:aminoacyl-tRNA deacylase [Actinospongicola halichondriae]|uniref:aminoacyl-tRNA deacylase n=1 Tax=Actinospongicola halichondriae TaxID=3236844 RepID=UPI003D47BEE8